MAGKRTRRHHRAQRARLSPIAIVAIVLACTILVTVIIGNLLNKWLDDETYKRLTEGTEPPPQINGMQPSSVRRVYATSMTPGDSIDALQQSISLSLNTPQGELLYSSPVADYYNVPMKKASPLRDTMSELTFFVEYVIGVFYPQALTKEAEDLRYAATTDEAALLREFVKAGGSEVLLCGLTISQSTLSDVIAYLKAVKAAVENVPVGIAIPYAVAMDSSNWELLAMLSEECDLCALDFTDVESEYSEPNEMGVIPEAKTILDGCRYFITQYSMRPLFGKSQRELSDTAIALDYPSWQILGEK